MITAAPPRLRSRTAPVLDLPSIAFYGRSFAEYCQMFSLDPAALRRRPVLDVAAGPSAFTADACRAGIDAVAVDPLYGSRPETLATHLQLDYQRVHRAMRDKPAFFRLKSFPSLEAAQRDRQAAARRFLDDYAAHFVHGRYFGASLPHLPFLDGAFDLVLCAHLLFIYAHQLDFAFHLAACRELVRVSRDEVRIHPVCGSDGRPYADFERLCDELARDGVAARVVPVAHEFFKGSNTMLVLTRPERSWCAAHAADGFATADA